VLAVAVMAAGVIGLAGTSALGGIAIGASIYAGALVALGIIRLRRGQLPGFAP
jgi:hypothetical protein